RPSHLPGRAHNGARFTRSGRFGYGSRVSRPRLGWCLVGGLLALGRALAAPCPSAGVLAIVADNRSADATVTLDVSGRRVASSGACDEAGTGLATAYATSVVCSGAGVVRCGRVDGLAPGVWVHRVSLQVAGSAPQVQAARGVVLGGGGTVASNVVEWT